MPHRIVILGGGFGGLYVARHLAAGSAEITLVDRRNHHLFQPLLYQVATGALSPANISAPLRSILTRRRNVNVWMAEAVGLDAPGRRLLLREGYLPYDDLVVATGSTSSYFGHDEWAGLAPGLKSVEEALDVRRRIYSALEEAERLEPKARPPGLLTFVIVGAGPTGVELAGALAEIRRNIVARDFRRLQPGEVRILLVDAADRVLKAYPPELSAKARRSLERMMVEVQVDTQVTDISSTGVRLGEEEVSARTVIWAAGVQASSFGRVLAAEAGAVLDKAGRVRVTDGLTIPGHAEISVIGDLARVEDAEGNPLPGLAPVAMQEARYCARAIEARQEGREVKPFQYRDRGMMATIGRAAAVVDLRWVRFSGFFAWVTWLLVHLMYLVQFGNRVLVLVQWAWNYVTFNRAARLITDTALSKSQVEAAPREDLSEGTPSEDDDSDERGTREGEKGSGLRVGSL